MIRKIALDRLILSTAKDPASRRHCDLVVAMMADRLIEPRFEALKALIAELDEEERRGAREGLTEEELAIFDLLTKPEPKLTKAEQVEVKKVARDLLMKLHDKLDVLDWQARQQTRAVVQSTIRFTLNELPEQPYPQALWETKVDAVWAYIFSRRQQVQGSEGLRVASPT
jgi:type I restriction enzyme R subunit